jgi:hypothetical protein
MQTFQRQSFSRELVCSMFFRRLVLVLGFLFSSCFMGMGLNGAEALRIDSISTYGLTSNATTMIELRGVGIDSSLRLWLPFDSQQKLVKVTPNEATMELSLGEVPDQIIWGLFQTDRAVDVPKRFAVDRFPSQGFSESVATLPMAVNGSLAGNESKAIQVTLKTGEQLLADIQARRLGATFQPLLRITDDMGRQVASSGPQLSRDGDAACSYTATRDGNYKVILQDLTFAAPAGNFRIRLSIKGVDGALKPEVVANAAIPSYPSAASALGWPVAGFAVSGRPILDVSAKVAGEAPKNDLGLVSSWTRLDLKDIKAEALANVGEVFRVPALPCIVRGVLKNNSKLKMLVACGAGKPVEAEVWGARLSADVDTRLRITAMDGRELASGDDSPGTPDSLARFGGDANVAEAIVELDSLIPIAAEGANFELMIHQAPTGVALLDIETPQASTVVGGWAIATLKIARQGVNSPIILSGRSLGLEANSAVEVPEVVIPPGKDRALIAMRLSDRAAPKTSWVALAGQYPDKETGRVSIAGIGSRKIRASGVNESLLSVSQTLSPLSLEPSWQKREGEVWELTAGLQYPLPMSWKFSWIVDNAAATGLLLPEAMASWKLKGELVSNQNIPRTNPQDGNSPLDMQKALQLVGGDGAVLMLKDAKSWSFSVPASALEDDFQVAVKWTLTDAADQPLSVPFSTPIQNVRITRPLKISLAKAVTEPWQYTKEIADAGVMVKVERSKGVEGMVTLRWEGLPQGVAAVTAQSDNASEVSEIKLPFPDFSKQPAGSKVDGLKIVAEWKPANRPDAPPYISPPTALPSLMFP